MKMLTPTRLRCALALSLSLGPLSQALAQAVPNGGFETWAARNGVEAPTNWLNTDDVVARLFGLRLATGTFSRTTDARSGSAAVRLESKTIATLLGPAVVPGFLVLGTKIGRNEDFTGGLPFIGRPTSLQFYYKLSGPQPAAADAPALAVALTRTVNGRAEVIGGAEYAFVAPAAAYVLVQVPLEYESGAAPDSVRLVVATNSETELTTIGGIAGTVLQIDDISFVGGAATATRNPALAAALSVAPNPSPDGRFVLRAAEPALLAAPLTVVDATGRVVRREPASATPGAAGTRALDLSGLAGGIYTLQLFTNKGLITKKLVLR